MPENKLELVAPTTSDALAVMARTRGEMLMTVLEQARDVSQEHYEDVCVQLFKQLHARFLLSDFAVGAVAEWRRVYEDEHPRC